MAQQNARRLLAACPAEADSLAYAASCSIWPEGVDEEHHDYLEDRGASGGKHGDAEVVYRKRQVVFLGVEGTPERLLCLNNLTFAGANPKHAWMTCIQERFDIVVVVRKQYPCRQFRDVLTAHLDLPRLLLVQ